MLCRCSKRIHISLLLLCLYELLQQLFFFIIEILKPELLLVLFADYSELKIGPCNIHDACLVCQPFINDLLDLLTFYDLFLNYLLKFISIDMFSIKINKNEYFVKRYTLCVTNMSRR